MNPKRTTFRLFFLLHAALALVLLSGTASVQAAAPAGTPEPPVEYRLEVNEAQPAASNVALLGQSGGGIKSAASAGNYVYLADGPRLDILDITQPNAPVLVGRSAVSAGIFQDVAVSADGNRAYMAAGSLGLRVFNTANKTAPLESGFYTWGAAAMRVATVGTDYVYALDAVNAKIWVIGVQNPAAPYLAGSSDTLTGVPQALAVTGDYAYVVNADNRMQILNIAAANITHPVVGGSVLLSGLPNPLTGPQDIAVDASGATPYAYIVGAEGVRRINLNTFAQAGAYSGPGHARAVAFDTGDSSVYTAHEDYGLQALSMDLATLKGTFNASPAYNMRDVVKTGAHLFAVDEDFGLRVVALPASWSSPPVTLNQTAIFRSYAVMDLEAAGGNAYLASDAGGLNILSVGAPANPTYLGGAGTSGTALGITLAGSRAYVVGCATAASGGLQIFDISNPANPTAVGAPVAVTGNSAAALDIDGDYAYLAANTAGLRVFDLTPAPAAAAQFDLGGTPPGWVYDVEKSGDYAYLAYGQHGLRIVSVPAAPYGNLVQAGAYDTPGDARGIALSGNYAYIADGAAGLRIVNVSDKANPQHVGSAPLMSGTAQDVAVPGTYAFVAAGSAGLRVFNVANPANPVEAGYYDTPGAALRIAADGARVYLADDSGGLFILEYSATPPPSSTISGRVLLSGSQTGIPGAILASSFGTSATSDASGNYTLTGAPTGVYTVTITLAGHICSPSVVTGSVPTDVQNKDFSCSVAPVGPYSISGTVVDAGTSAPLPNVMITDGTVTTTTDSSGKYTISGLVPGSYTISAVMSGYTFTATFTNPVVITNANQSGKNFSGTQGSGSGYTISGRITDAAQNPVPWVIVSDGTRSASTDSGGNYTISGVPYGSYQIVPQKSGTSFSPASMNVAVPPNASGRDFKAAVHPPYTVSGRITDEADQPVANVTVSDGKGRTTSTDSNGNYTLSGLPAGAYTITPSKSGYTFTPATLIGTVPPNGTNRDFKALPAPTYTISGRIATQLGAAIPGVTVMDVGGRSAVTDADGNYTISNVPAGNFTVAASKGGYIFSPDELNGSLPPNATAQNFTGIQVGTLTPTPTGSPSPGGNRITGKVSDEHGEGLSGVTISDGLGHTAVSDAGGQYTLSGLPAGAYTVTPSRSGYACSPVNRQVSLPPDAEADFVCSAAVSSISGMVMDAHGSPIAGVALSDGQGHTAISGSDGRYVMSNLKAGAYSITPSKSEHIFEPPMRTVNVPPAALNVNFFGTSGVVDIIVNGNMEKAEAWVMPYDRAGYEYETGGAVTLDIASSPQSERLQREAIAGYSAQEVHGGNRSMRVGILDPAKNVLSYSTGRQKVFIPASAKCAVLRFWLYPRSEVSTDGADFQMVSILDDNLNQIQRVLTERSDRRAWGFYDYDLDLNKVKGKSVWVYFGVFNDGHNSVMAYYVDDVSLSICSKNIPPLPPTTPTPTVLPQN